MAGKKRCRIHGGASPGGKIKHGARTKEGRKLLELLNFSMWLLKELHGGDKKHFRFRATPERVERLMGEVLTGGMQKAAEALDKRVEAARQDRPSKPQGEAEPPQAAVDHPQAPGSPGKPATGLLEAPGHGNGDGVTWLATRFGMVELRDGEPVLPPVADGERQKRPSDSQGPAMG